MNLMFIFLFFLVHLCRMYQLSIFDFQNVSHNDLFNLLSTVSSIHENKCTSTLVSLLMSGEFSSALSNFILNSGKRANDLGNYNGCSKAMNTNYIVAGIYFSKTNFTRIGVCFPKECTLTELIKLKGTAASFFSRVLKRDIKEENIHLQAVEKEKTGLGFNFTWVFISLLVLIAIIATIIDNKGYCTEEKTQQSSLIKLASCFSLPRNIDNFFKSINVQDNNLMILNGVRLVLMAWFVLSNTYLTEFLSPAYNRAERYHMMLNEFRFAFVKSGTMALDSFFFISGFFAASSLYLIFTDKKARTPKTFLACYLYKYLRLLPITVFTILLMIFIAPSAKSFPLNPHLKTIPETCSKSWYLTLLYAGNFQGYDDICIDWSWFLMNDMQFYLLAPFLILAFLHSKFLGNIILLALGTISIIVTGVIYSSYNLHMSLVKDFNKDYYSVYYIRPYCRILPYLMGIFFYMMYKDGKSNISALRKFNTFIERGGKYILCLIGLVLMFLAVIVIYFLDKYPNSWSTGLAIAHELISRPLFVFGLILLLYPSLIGHNKLLVYIFGHPILNPFGKLTYSVYMAHFIVLYLVLVYGQISYFVTETFIFFRFFTIISVAYLLSFGITILIELPVLQILRGFIKRHKENEDKIEGEMTPIQSSKESLLSKDDNVS